MPNYVIGDVHGCLDTLRQLIYEIDFDLEKDYAWFTGDLVNRGPKSLETLRFIKAFGEHAICVLGNHDISLLRKYFCKIENELSRKIFNAQDGRILMEWLRTRPLFYHDEDLNIAMVHAGIIPEWDLEKIKKLSKEVEEKMQEENPRDFFENIFGNEPDTWNENLSGIEKYRYIVNCFTRIRFCEKNGKMDLKSTLKDKPKTPIWFTHDINLEPTLFFGHFAELNGKCEKENIIAMDTGCVWGGYLAAYCVETKVVTKVRLIDNVSVKPKH